MNGSRIRLLVATAVPIAALSACSLPSGPEEGQDTDDEPELDGMLYWAEGGRIGWVDVYSDSSASNRMSHDVPPGDCMGFDVDLVNDRMFWIEAGGPIMRADLDGGNEETLYTPSGVPTPVPRSITVDPNGGKVYWVDTGLEAIYVADLDGSARTEWLAGVTDVASIVVAPTTPSELFWYN